MLQMGNQPETPLSISVISLVTTIRCAVQFRHSTLILFKNTHHRLTNKKTHNFMLWSTCYFCHFPRFVYQMVIKSGCQSTLWRSLWRSDRNNARANILNLVYIISTEIVEKILNTRRESRPIFCVKHHYCSHRTIVYVTYNITICSEVMASQKDTMRRTCGTICLTRVNESENVVKSTDRWLDQCLFSMKYFWTGILAQKILMVIQFNSFNEFVIFCGNACQ